MFLWLVAAVAGTSIVAARVDCEIVLRTDYKNLLTVSCPSTITAEWWYSSTSSTMALGIRRFLSHFAPRR